MKRYIIAPSGSGLSEMAWELAESTSAAWVGNNAAAHLTLLRPTVEQELAFGMEQDGVPAEVMRERIAAAAAQWGLSALLHRDPTRLSTGQTRRVAIAQALLRNPGALVLDCPLDGCDAAAAATLVQVVRDFPGDVTIFDRVLTPLASVCEVDDRYPTDGHDPTAPLPQLAPLGSMSSSHDPMLELHNLTVEREGFTLGPISATLHHGVTHIDGPNGTGKTTLLLAMADLIPHSGPAFGLAYGWAPTDMDTSFSRKTVLEEVALGSTREHAAVALEFCGVTEFAQVHPLDVPSSPRRLVSLACALVRGPSVLLVDEPTVGLDRDGRWQLRSIFDGFVRGHLHAELAARGLPTLGPPHGVVWTCHHRECASLSHHQLKLASPATPHEKGTR